MNFRKENNISFKGEARKYDNIQQRKHNKRPNYFARHYNFLKKKPERSNHLKSTPPMITNNGFSNAVKADRLKVVRH